MINYVMQLAYIFFLSVERRDTLLSEQNEIFVKFISEFKERVGVKNVRTNIDILSELLGDTNETIHHE